MAFREQFLLDLNFGIFLNVRLAREALARLRRRGSRVII